MIFNILKLNRESASKLEVLNKRCMISEMLTLCCWNQSLFGYYTKKSVRVKIALQYINTKDLRFKD